MVHLNIFMLPFRKLYWKENIYEFFLTSTFLITRAPVPGSYTFISETIACIKYNNIRKRRLFYLLLTTQTKWSTWFSFSFYARKPKMYYKWRAKTSWNLHLVALWTTFSSQMRSRFASIRSINSLTHFCPMSHFYTPWKRQKTYGFWRFQGV